MPGQFQQVPLTTRTRPSCSRTALLPPLIVCISAVELQVPLDAATGIVVKTTTADTASASDAPNAKCLRIAVSPGLRVLIIFSQGFPLTLTCPVLLLGLCPPGRNLALRFKQYLVTPIANCESLVPSRKRRPSHCPSVPPGDGYTFEDGSSSKLNTRGVAPLSTIPVRSDGVRTFKAYAPNTRAGFGGNPQQSGPIACHGSAHDRPALAIPVQDPR